MWFFPGPKNRVKGGVPVHPLKTNLKTYTILDFNPKYSIQSGMYLHAKNLKSEIFI